MSRQRWRGANIWLVNHDDVKVKKGQGVTQLGAEKQGRKRSEGGEKIERKLDGSDLIPGKRALRV